jgi:hypothetical protein
MVEDVEDLGTELQLEVAPGAAQPSVLEEGGTGARVPASLNNLRHSTETPHNEFRLGVQNSSLGRCQADI